MKASLERVPYALKARNQYEIELEKAGAGLDGMT